MGEDAPRQCPICADKGLDFALKQFIYRFDSVVAIGDGDIPRGEPFWVDDGSMDAPQYGEISKIDHLWCPNCRNNFNTRGIPIDFDPDDELRIFAQEIHRRMLEETGKPSEETVTEEQEVADGDPEMLP